jgi:hypothetical protein
MPREDVVFVHVGLGWDIKKKRIMTIQMKSFEPQWEYNKILGVTEDGLWLDKPRRYYDSFAVHDEFDFTTLMRPTTTTAIRTILFDDVYYTQRTQRQFVAHRDFIN